MSPGEFAVRVREAVEAGQASVIVIDSLNGYLQSMPGERFLVLQMHELLSFLNQSGVITILILGHHGMVGELRATIDLSYLADSVIMLRFFESDGVVRKAISVMKTRTTQHERTIREFRLDAGGLTLGPPIRGFSGVLGVAPRWTGEQADLMQSGRDYADPAVADEPGA